VLRGQVCETLIKLSPTILQISFKKKPAIRKNNHNAPKLAELAKKFDADIRLIHEEESVDCKSILDVMTMACTKGTPVSIRASGKDANNALAAIEQLIQNNFDEE